MADEKLTVYVVVRCARDPGGEIMVASPDGAFRDAAVAERFVKERGVVWEEVIAGYPCYCERAIFPVEVI